jgi:hypothetical protein
MSAVVTIAYERWACVTAGEYDRRAHRVVVNEAVVDAVVRDTGRDAAIVRAAIVAHERAHAFARGATLEEDEARARAAAVEAAGAAVVDAIDRVLREHRDADRSGC